MEGGNKQSINLEAPLDVSTSDMLVRIGQNTWQHNWQKWQGKCLPNSLRFEKNGWAAGWNVFDFDYKLMRQAVGPMFAGATRVNNNPTYIIDFYETEDGAKSTGSTVFTPYSKLLSYTNCTAELTGDTISGNVNGQDFEILWDRLTETATIAGANVSLEYWQNNDYTWTFQVTDVTSILTVSDDIYYPANLTGTGLQRDQFYTGYDNGLHSWGKTTTVYETDGGGNITGMEVHSDFEYDGTSLKVPGLDAPITPTVVGVNGLQFSYDAELDTVSQLTLSFDTFYLAFNDLKLEPGTGDNLLVNDSASEMYTDNFISANIRPDSLRAGEDPLIIDMLAPVWLTACFRVQDGDATGMALKPNNTRSRNIGVKMDGYGYYFHVKTQGAFGDTWEGDLTIVENVANKTLHSDKEIHPTPTYRFCKISIGNSIAAGPDWNPQAITINNEVWCFSAKAFTALSTTDNRTALNKKLGNVYTIGQCYYNANDYFEKNKWDNWYDKTNPVYTWPILTNICKIKKKGAADFVGNYTEAEYIAANFMNNTTLCDTYVAKLTGAVSTYSAGQAALTSLADAFDSNGVYVGGTYEYVGRTLTSDGNFWPFEYIPCINLQTDPGDPGDPDADPPVPAIPPTIIKIYPTSSTSYETTVAGYKTYVMPYSGGSLQNAVTTPDSAFNVTRMVYRFPVVLDFPIDEDHEDGFLHGFDEKDIEAWDKWYPGVASPFNWPVGQRVYDSTYLDYLDIEIEQVDELEMDCTYPGIVICTSGTKQWAVNAINTKDVIPMADFTGTTPPDPLTTLRIYHNHVDATALYEVNTAGAVYPGPGDPTPDVPITDPPGGSENSLGYLDASGFPSGYKFLMPNYFKKDVEVNGSTTDTNGHKKDKVKIKAHSGSISCIIKAKSTKCWVNSLPISAADGTVKAEASVYKAVFVPGSPGGPSTPGYPSRYNWVLDGSFGPEWADNVETFNNIICGQDDVDGVVVAQALYGHAAIRVEYPDIKSKTEIQRTDGDGMNLAFIISPVPDADIPVNDRKRIWIDRTSINDLSYDWFSLAITAVLPDGVGDGRGYMQTELKPKGDAVLFYTSKVVVEKKDKDGNIKSTEEKFMAFHYPPVAGENGYMKSAPGSGTMGYDKLCFSKVTFTPESFRLPIGGSLSTAQFQSDVPHTFMSDGVQAFKTAEVKSDGLAGWNRNTHDLKFWLEIDGQLLELNYNSDAGTVNSDVLIMEMANATVTFGPVNMQTDPTGKDTSKDASDVPVTAVMHFIDITGKFAAVSPDTMLKYYNGKVTIQRGDIEFVYDMSRQKVLDLDTKVSVENFDDHQHIEFEYKVVGTINAVMSNVVNGQLRVKVAGNDYYLNVMPYVETDDTVDVMTTDIRQPDKTHRIGKLISSNEFQIVKQQWNTTVEVENFWWVDDTHVLELNQFEFVLKRKTDDLDDWAGDRFMDIYHIDRADILNPKILKYFVTNTYNTDLEGYFITMEVDSTYVIKCNIYDIRDRLTLLDSIYFELSKHEIGDFLNTYTRTGKTAMFNTYTPLTAGQLLSQAQWSNTVTDDRLFIGCHQSNNFDQWTAVFTVPDFNCESCTQGYGFVGLDGCLTGGELPDAYFAPDQGFTSAVNDIKVLSKVNEGSDDVDEAYLIEDGHETDINAINDIVVGTAERQWYISRQLYGIVSHIKWDPQLHDWEVCLLPITNKFEAVYKSPSFKNEMLCDLMLEVFRFADMFQMNGAASTVWEVLMGMIGEPLIYMFNPRYATMVYLQQTLGQYAYVHYNSSESNERPAPKNTAGDNGMGDVGQPTEIKAGPAQAPVLSDEYTFDKQIFRQNVGLSTAYDKLYHILFATFASALNYGDRVISVNAELNQTATMDMGKKYSQMAMENLGSLVTDAIMTQSKDVGLTSQVVGIRSLDMFYSTSDKQQIQAGPGFVEHRFVADCVSQSVTDVNVEGSVQQLSYTIKALTMLQGKIAQYTIILVADGMDKLAEIIAKQMVCGTSLAAAGAAMSGVATGLRAYAEILMLVYEELGNTLDVMTQRGITSERVGQVSRQSMTSEGKHKYGEKSETFMWPCWGIPTGGLSYTDETVNAAIKESKWKLTLCAAKYYVGATINSAVNQKLAGLSKGETIDHSSMKNAGAFTYSSITNLNTDIPFYQASCYGTTEDRILPEDMACIQGVPSFLPTQAFKNENIGASDPGFSPSLFQDYIIDKTWNISQCATYGMPQWITCKDTKITNCPPSNMRINTNFCGVATPYSAIEVKRGLSKAYMRPYAITPNVLAFNCTGYNSIMDNKLYHAFDGLSYRIVEWTGSPGLMKQTQTFLYSFQVNDRFKRSNKFPANEVLGAFNSEPTQAIESLDKLWTQVNIATKEKGMEAGTVGEDKDLIRWAIPVFTEPVTTLPAAVKTMTAMPLIVADGITCLVTDLYNNQAAYKAPLSVDFTIGKNVYRQTEEYISSVQTSNGVDIITDLVPTLGLKYIGSTPTEAYFYSEATRCYYIFTGGSLSKMDMLERFRDVKGGYWDFVNQEVVMPCLMTFKRLNPEVEDKDTETDNIIVPVMSKGTVSGELPPPLTTIFNDRSWYKTVSLPSGLAYQGPNRVIINRSVFVEYMLDTIKSNLGKWKRMDREKYTTKRGYPEHYEEVTKSVDGVEGWTYNPFLLVTSALGQSEDTDCLYEWVITFCWPIEMDLIYGQDNYAVVNITAETMTPGGKVKSRPTHVFLTKELFTRNGNYGYYSFRYQSKNGAGNRERLHIWCDQYIAVSSIDCEAKVVTSRRTEILTQQQDVQLLEEL